MKTPIHLVEVGKEVGKLITTACAYAPYHLAVAFYQSTKIILRIGCVNITLTVSRVKLVKCTYRMIDDAPGVVFGILLNVHLINLCFSLGASWPGMGLVSGALATAPFFTGRLRGDCGAGICSTQWSFGDGFCSTELCTSDLRPRGCRLNQEKEKMDVNRTFYHFTKRSKDASMDSQHGMRSYLI